MTKGIRHLLTSLRGDERGTSVIELAFIAPVIALMIMGMSDLARGYSQKLTLEQAAHRALEQAAAGAATMTVSGASDYSYLKAEAATAAGIPQSGVTVTTWLECDGVKQPAFDGVCGSTQMVSRYVQVDLASTYQPTFDYTKISRRIFATAADGTIPLSAGAALRVQ